MNKKSTPQTDDHQEDEELNEAFGQRFILFNVMPSWLVSFLVHVVLIIILAVAYWTIPLDEKVGLVTGEPAQDMSTMDNIDFPDADNNDTLNENTEVEESNQDELSETVEEMEVDTEIVEPANSDSLSEAIEQASINADANAAVGALSGAAEKLSGRGGKSRAAALAANGGNAASENAVKMAMEWLAKHQLPDGSWSFDHRAGPNAALRASPNPGDFTDSPNAATAMALLVFLGADQTHTYGDYQEVVDKGLAFLIKNGEKVRIKTRSGSTFGLSYSEPDGLLYSHGLVAIVIMEAYAMTEDTRFDLPCRQILNYIEYCQDPQGGGWRYDPQQAGDTSVVGWQVMALKSAVMCGLDVDPVVVRKARRFLNFVSSESGAFYGYEVPSRKRTKGVTSVGLLSQMYLGWDKENPALQRGADWLCDRGPDVGDWKPEQTDLSEAAKSRFKCGMYYNYYATQVIHQYDGPRGGKWKKWNLEMRDFLIATQASEGPAKGSWFFKDANEGGYTHGGRLYATTMAAMTLEVYYRYLSLYDQEKTSEAEFELD